MKEGILEMKNEERIMERIVAWAYIVHYPSAYEFYKSYLMIKSNFIILFDT